MGSDRVGGTEAELERMLGQHVRALRLLQNLPQTTLAEMAGVSTETLRGLEGGHGTTVRTLLAVVRALGRQEWLNALAADGVATSPVGEVCRTLVRQRARCVRNEPSQ
jgi:transcriptional regulator with XRE-family HTH domain